jgi:Lon protease-like protein
MRVPLFPLNTVLFPGGPLPLRIFETRYIDMIGDCMRRESPFGVLLIKDGLEAGTSTTHELGTLARIQDFYQGSDGLLGVTAVGGERFTLLSAERQADGLNVGEVELLPAEERTTLPAEYEGIAEILEGVLDDLGRLYESLERHYDDAGWVSYRFAEILPLDLEQKQRCLESDDPLLRLKLVNELLDAVRRTQTGATDS